MIHDGLKSHITALGKMNGYRDGPLTSLMHDTALGVYQSSALLKKVVNIPAEDRVREWRDWQASARNITLAEAEEKRLDLRAKVEQAEVLRRIGGGAIIIITRGQDHDKELSLDRINQGDIVALPVVSRWQLTAEGWYDEITDPLYGTPKMWRLPSESNSVGELIHPSRVIAFRGKPLPLGSIVTPIDAYWGDSFMMTVVADVLRSDDTQCWFSHLVKKSKLTRIGIPNLSQVNDEKLGARISIMATGEGILNATVYDSGDGKDSPAESISDYQVSWNGIPAVMDAFDQRVAAVSDIPFTRLMGRSPAGMNATGESDQENWNKMVRAGQELETRPCLELLDPALLRSAGIRNPDKITWKFAPLDVPNEKEEAETFKIIGEALTHIRNMNVIPEEAFNEAVQNTLIEREYVPGLEQALKKIPESERFGINVNADEQDPSSIQAGREGSNVSGIEGDPDG